MADRHYGLFANNQHPIQLETYAAYNSFLQDLNDINHIREEEAFNDNMNERLNKAQEALDTDAGERLSIEDFEDIYMDAMADKRARSNMSRNARGRDGELNDYLELRRPFGAAQ